MKIIKKISILLLMLCIGSTSIYTMERDLRNISQRSEEDSQIKKTYDFAAFIGNIPIELNLNKEDFWNKIIQKVADSASITIPKTSLSKLFTSKKGTSKYYFLNFDSDDSRKLFIEKYNELKSALMETLRLEQNITANIRITEKTDRNRSPRSVIKKQAVRSSPPGTNYPVFIGNIPKVMEKEALFGMFKEIIISLSITTNINNLSKFYSSVSGTSQFAFFRLRKEEDREKFINEYNQLGNNHPIKQLDLKVKVAQKTPTPKKPRTDNVPKKTDFSLYIGNIPEEFTQKTLLNKFKNVANIAGIAYNTFDLAKFGNAARGNTKLCFLNFPVESDREKFLTAYNSLPSNNRIKKFKIRRQIKEPVPTKKTTTDDNVPDESFIPTLATTPSPLPAKSFTPIATTPSPLPDESFTPIVTTPSPLPDESFTPALEIAPQEPNQLEETSNVEKLKIHDSQDGSRYNHTAFIGNIPLNYNTEDIAKMIKFVFKKTRIITSQCGLYKLKISKRGSTHFCFLGFNKQDDLENFIKTYNEANWNTSNRIDSALSQLVVGKKTHPNKKIAEAVVETRALDDSIGFPNADMHKLIINTINEENPSVPLSDLDNMIKANNYNFKKLLIKKMNGIYVNIISNPANVHERLTKIINIFFKEYRTTNRLFDISIIHEAARGQRHFCFINFDDINNEKLFLQFIGNLQPVKKTVFTFNERKKPIEERNQLLLSENTSKTTLLRLFFQSCSEKDWLRMFSIFEKIVSIIHLHSPMYNETETKGITNILKSICYFLHIEGERKESIIKIPKVRNSLVHNPLEYNITEFKKTKTNLMSHIKEILLLLYAKLVEKKLLPNDYDNGNISSESKFSWNISSDSEEEEPEEVVPVENTGNGYNNDSAWTNSSEPEEESSLDSSSESGEEDLDYGYNEDFDWSSSEEVEKYDELAYQ